MTIAETLQKALVVATGAKSFEDVRDRLGFAGFLVTCACCGGAGVKMPKMTAKLVQDAAEFFTPEKKAECDAELAARAAVKQFIDESPMMDAHRRRR